MTAEEFKERAIKTLEYCMELTRETAKDDGVEDEHDFIDYCCGFEEAIAKLKEVSTDVSQ